MGVFERLNANRSWTEDESILLDQVSRVAEEVIKPGAAEYDRSGEFPGKSVSALNELGLNAIFIPQAYGGAALSYRVYLECVATISAACASTGIIYATNFHGMAPLIDFGTEKQKARLLPRIAKGGLGALAITEPSAGSDATGMKTQFQPEGADIVVNGSKTFISNGDKAELILLFGKWSEINDPRDSITALILERDTPGLKIGSKEIKMGHRAAPTVPLMFDACRVPRANLLGEPGDGLRILLSSLNKSRPSVAAHALGIARAAFADMISYTNEREQAGRKIIDFQGNQFLIAELASELALIESWIDYIAELIQTGVSDFGIEASIAKMRASDLAMRMTTEAVQMHGGYGYIADYRVERLMRDAKITQIWEGTNQVHRQLIGRSFRVK